MRRQLWMIAKVWAYRPMMWLLAIVAIIALLASTGNRSRTTMRSAFVIPYEYGSMGSVKLAPMSTLKDGEVFQQSARSSEIDTTVVGIDLKSMDLRDPTHPLDFSSLEQALANFPSVRWIRFDTDQIQHVSNETLSKLSELETIIIHDHQVTQADVDQLAGVGRLQMLVLETLDFPASLSTLSELPSLNTLVLSHDTFGRVDDPIASLFRPEVLTQTHELVHLRRLVLMPQWLPGEGYFDGSKTPCPACDPILKENAARLLPGHPSLTDLWVGITKQERRGKDLATVQAAMPDVNVRSAQYNENSISRAGFGSFAIMLLTWICMYNLNGHFSTPQRRVIPNYEKPHLRFVVGFAALAVVIATVAIHAPLGIAWLPALAVSLLAVTLAATLMANMTITSLRHPALAWILTITITSLLGFQLIRPFLRQAIPTVEPAMDHFLSGHHPVLALVIACVCVLVICWTVGQFRNNDRLNAEAGLAPVVTVEDFGKQQETLGLQRRGKAYQRALDAWNSQLATLKSQPGGWLRDVQLDGMGEPTMRIRRWTGILSIATVIVYCISRLSFQGREFAMMEVCAILIAIGLMIPVLTSLARRDVMPLELLFPNSRAQFMRRRTFSIAVKFSCLSAGLLVFVAIAQFVCFRTLDLENVMRAAIAFAVTTIAGTGLVLWGSSIRNIFAMGLLVVLSFAILGLASFSCFDFRWIEHGKSGEEIHAFVSSPLFYTLSFSIAGLLLWTGFYRLSRCEVARQ